MQKFLLAVLIAAFALPAMAQKKQETPPLPPPQLPMDQVTKKITYEEVVNVPGVSAPVLYQRIVGWFNNYYKNPTEVIRDRDSVNYSITGKPRFKVYNLPDKEGTKTEGGLVQYTITVTAKEGRFKFEMTEFNWKQPSYYPLERWFDTAMPSYDKSFEEYLRQTDNYAKTTMADLKNAVTTEKAVKNKDDW